MTTIELLNQLNIPTYTEGAASQLQYQGKGADQIGTELNNRLNMYSGLFESLVGRKPGDSEFRQMFDAILPKEMYASGNADQQTQLRNVASQYISDSFQRQAKDYAYDQLVQQEAEANRLGELFRTQGNQAINDTESSLVDYQNRLFERLRPNLITSLQTQGLLNTGGLNQAIAGAQGDLAMAGSEELRNLRLQNEQQANAIKFAGASAPYQFKTNNIMNQLPYMQGQGQNALNQNFQTMLTNLNFQNQLALQRDARGGGKSGFFNQLAGSLPGAINMGLGQALGAFGTGQSANNFAQADYYRSKI